MPWDCAARDDWDHDWGVGAEVYLPRDTCRVSGEDAVTLSLLCGYTSGGEDGDEGPFRECLVGDPSGEASPSRRGDTRSGEPSGERAGERDVSASGERSSGRSPKRVGEAERVGERVGEAG